MVKTEKEEVGLDSGQEQAVAAKGPVPVTESKSVSRSSGYNLRKARKADGVKRTGIKLKEEQQFDKEFGDKDDNEEMDATYNPEDQNEEETDEEEDTPEKRKETPIKRNYPKLVRQQVWECNICTMKVSISCKSFHFASSHDLTGISPDKIFHCEEDNCKAYFVKRSQLVNHLYKIHDKDYCQPSTTNSEPAVIATKSFKCTVCDQKFTLESRLKKHELQYHYQPDYIRTPIDKKYVETGKKSFICKIDNCTEKFKSESSLELHQKLHGSWNCKFCSEQISYAPDLALHEFQQHWTTTTTAPESSEARASPEPKPSCSAATNETRYICLRCNYHNNRKTQYVEHFLRKHLSLSMRILKCHVCGAKFALDSYQKKKLHFNSHHSTEGISPEDLHRCADCPAYFREAIQLVRHQRRAHVQRNQRQICKDCGGTFKSRRVLVEHIRIYHLNTLDEQEAPELCQVPNCGRRFRTKGELEQHMAWGHLRKEKITGWTNCTICGKRVLGERGLRAHVSLAHTKKKKKENFVCETCGKAFKLKCKFLEHKEWHKDKSAWKWKCDKCEKTCINRFKLAEHQRVHTQEKAFQCEICGQKYAHRHNYRGHMKKQHGVELEKLPAKRKTTIKEKMAAMAERKQ